MVNKTQKTYSPYKKKKYSKKKYSKNKTKPQTRSKKHSRKKKHTYITKKQYGGNKLPENPNEYYCDFMMMKTDGTKVLHKSDKLRQVCLQLSQELTHRLYSTVNPLLEVVRNNILIPRWENERTNPDNKQFTQLINQIFENNTQLIQQYMPIFQGFLGVGDGQGITSDDLYIIGSQFYRFYLKGGTAMSMVVEYLQEEMNRIIDEQGKDTPGQITREDLAKIIGDPSDYDFNFVLNPYLTEDEFNMLRDQSIVFLYDFFVEVITTHPFFSNTEFKKAYQSALWNHIPTLPTQDTPPVNSVFVQRSFYENVRSDILRERVRNVKNNGFNQFSEVSLGFNSFENPLGEELRNTQFVLIRLMTQLPLDTTKIPVRCQYPDGNLRKTPNVAGEMIDISIPIYTSVEKLSKWYESNNTTRINYIYLYNIYAMIHDLEIIIEEAKHKSDGGGTKIDKRHRRLNFFQKLLCILPAKLHPDAEHLTNACSKVVESICQDSIQPYETVDFDQDIGLQISPSYNLKTLSQTLVSIFTNFPESIQQSKRGDISIFLLVKQYFYVYLTSRINDIYTHALSEVYSSLQKNQLSSDPNFHDLYYIDTTNMKFMYYTLFSLSSTGTVTEKIDLNIAIYQYIATLLSYFERNIQSIENDEQRNGIQTHITKILCSYLLEFNHMVVSTNDNTLMFDIISQFANILIRLYRDYSSVPLQFLPQNNPTQFYIGNNLMIARDVVYERSLFKQKLNKEFVKQHFLGLLSIYSHSHTQVFQKQGFPLESYQYTIRGGFLYSIYKIVQDKIQHGYENISIPDEIETNDMDTSIFISEQSPKQFTLLVNSLYSYFKDAFTNYFNNVYSRDIPRRGKRISLSLRTISDNHALIQIILYDFVSLNSSLQSVFINTIKSFYPNAKLETLYRIFESHVFEINIYNSLPPRAEQYHPIEALGNYVPFSGENPWIPLLKSLNEELNNTFNSVLPEELRARNIDIRHLYFQDIYKMTKEYQQILYEGKDAIHKQKYIHRLLGTTPHEPVEYNKVEPVIDAVINQPDFVLPMTTLTVQEPAHETGQAIGMEVEDDDI